jgi:hypothetical protein
VKQLNIIAVILVEGEDDILFYKHLLRLVDPDWEDRFGIE